MRHALCPTFKLTGLVLCLLASVSVFSESLRSYPLPPGDALSLQVWGEPDLFQEVLIAPDGTFSFPLIGSVAAAGRNADEIEDEMVQRLDKFVSDANVTLSVVKTSGNVIYVLGQVTRPGQFLMPGHFNVTQALSVAGGMTPFASVNDIRILRDRGGEKTTFVFRYSDIEKGLFLEQNIDLVSGDVVIVP